MRFFSPKKPFDPSSPRYDLSNVVLHPGVAWPAPKLSPELKAAILIYMERTDAALATPFLRLVRRGQGADIALIEACVGTWARRIGQREPSRIAIIRALKDLGIPVAQVKMGLEHFPFDRRHLAWMADNFDVLWVLPGGADLSTSDDLSK